MDVDWEDLKALRALYIADPATQQSGLKRDYWRDARLLAAYDKTFAARIGWKWEAVLEELGADARFVVPPDATLYDWGTGTGIAPRAVLDAGFTPQHVRVWDRSAQAVAYACKKVGGRAFDPSAGLRDRPALLTISHVLTELDSTVRNDLLQLATEADAIIWVEPGTPPVARLLAEIREQLRPHYTVLAPCTHQNICGMLTPGNATNWCHHFAKPPSEASRDPFWAEFQKRLSIDLRSLPVSYLVLARGQFLTQATAEEGARVIARPRPYKGHTKYLACAPTGVTEQDYPHRAGKSAAKALASAPFRLIMPATLPATTEPDSP